MRDQIGPAGQERLFSATTCLEKVKKHGKSPKGIRHTRQNGWLESCCHAPHEALCILLMRNTLKRLSVTSVAAVAIFATTTVTNASAASGGAACSVTGASGSLTFTNWTATRVDISGWVKDTVADGYPVAIRFVSIDGGTGWVHEWPWHTNSGGNGSTLNFTTYAAPSGDRLSYIGAQVAVMNGGRIVRSCANYA
ncbi:hypothetical protein [Streptomyces sp. NPDC000994]